MTESMDDMRKRLYLEGFYERHGMLDPKDVKHAEDRNAIHQGHLTHRPLSKDYELVGVAGERAFSEWAHIDMDRKLRPTGNGSVNFKVAGKKINVYAARKPRHLLVEKKKAKSDIYVLARYSEATEKAALIGWAWKDEVLKAPARDYGGMGVVSHGIERAKLRKMETLAPVLGIVTGGRTLPLWEDM